ncbi:gamma-interferon-inducible lysosomal thiol reductase-like isoform X2 [Rhodnius prolixus]|uniref:gamma-interferon-inducible lysosomal thiol reductase-like isoform X2 n=1 Tax=Rhodnius prolixus TaxID=13249 RepID=UPI003D18829B
MFVSKLLRAKLVLFAVILLALWLIYYYLFRVTQISNIKDTTGINGLVPEMPYSIMNADNVVHNEAVLISVYYECLCPDSRSFFTNQLQPLVEKLPISYLKMDLIPYGKAETETVSKGKYRFTCQHGPLECLGNKIHGCTLQMTSDDVIRVKVITCMIDENYNPKEIGKKCCEQYNISWSKVEKCAMGPEGDLLLKKYGDATDALIPKVSFIPTILLDKELHNQAAILKDLQTQVCNILKKSRAPRECE